MKKNTEEVEIFIEPFGKVNFNFNWIVGIHSIMLREIKPGSSKEGMLVGHPGYTQSG